MAADLPTPNMVASRWRQVLLTVLSCYTWLEIGVVCILGCMLHWVVFLLSAPFDPLRLISGRFYRNIAVLALRLAPLWSFQLQGQVPKRLRRRTVVVCNHVSHLDSFVIATLPWEMKWLAKKSLYRIPFVGWNMHLTGDIAVVRGDAASAEAAMQRCAAYLEHHVPVCIFPEGTRALGETLLPFKSGAFRLAIAAGADVLPLAISGTQQALRKHSWRCNFARGVLRVGEPIVTTGMRLEDVDRLREQVQQRISALLQAKEMP